MKIDTLRRALSRPLPGRTEQYRMAHYVRMRFKDMDLNELPENHRRSAVLALLFEKDSEWHVVLMRRAESPYAHSKQISFPGGGMEPQDGGDPAKAALREAQEELGIDPSQVELLGNLTELYIPVSNNLVFPFVGVVENRPNYVLDPNEAEEVLEAPLRFFHPDAVKHTEVVLREGVSIKEVPYFDVHGHVVWGATAMMMSELMAVLYGEL